MEDLFNKYEVNGKAVASFATFNTFTQVQDTRESLTRAISAVSEIGRMSADPLIKDTCLLDIDNLSKIIYQLDFGHALEDVDYLLDVKENNPTPEKLMEAAFPTLIVKS